MKTITWEEFISVINDKTTIVCIDSAEIDWCIAADESYIEIEEFNSYIYKEDNETIKVDGNTIYVKDMNQEDFVDDIELQIFKKVPWNRNSLDKY